ncbi:hypothetical protein V6N13_109258 [Hibiscus sabdariffa]
MNARIASFIPILQFVGLSENKLVLTKPRGHTQLYEFSKSIKARSSLEYSGERQDDKGDVSVETTGPAQAVILAGLQTSAERLAVLLVYP